MLRRLATLKAAKKNAGFAPSIIHKGVGTAGLPHLSDRNLLGKPKYLAFSCVSLLRLSLYLVAKNTF